jgi:hypothetical protein
MTALCESPAKVFGLQEIDISDGEIVSLEEFGSQRSGRSGSLRGLSVTKRPAGHQQSLIPESSRSSPEAIRERPSDLREGVNASYRDSTRNSKEPSPCTVFINPSHLVSW